MNIAYCPMNVLLVRMSINQARYTCIYTFFYYITILIFIGIIQIRLYLGPITVKCQVPDTVIALLLTLVKRRLQELAVTLYGVTKTLSQPPVPFSTCATYTVGIPEKLS